MEVLFAILIFALAAAGLALGVLLGRPPIKGSCGGADCTRSGACAACPRRQGR